MEEQNKFPHEVAGFNIELEAGNLLIKPLEYLKVNLLKEVMEYFAIEFKDKDNKIDYKINAKEEDFEQFNNVFCVPDVPFIPQTSAQVMANAETVIAALMEQLGLTREQAAGITGVLGAENGVNPHSYNVGEKKGTYHTSGANNEGGPYGSKHSPWSYGAGIGAWTFCGKKEQVLGGLGMSREQAKNFIMTKGIESLGLEDQIKMLIHELTKYQGPTLQGISKCTSPELAAATYYCHAVAGSRYASSTEPATQAQIAEFNGKYAKVGANSQINKGMGWARKFYDKRN